jgi:hypothetical protein
MTAIVACTIITKNYVAYARTLALSLAEHNPGSTLYVLLADRLDNYFDPQNEPFKLIQLEELSNQKVVEDMCFYYTPFELCCALRGMLHEYMFEKTDAQSWLFIDSDILVCNSLEGILRQLETTSILVCPHCTTTVEIKFVRHHDLTLLQMGVYNAGFLGLRRTSTTREFISWFRERLQLYGFNKPTQTQYVDQLWLNFVPLLFKDVSLLLDPGANLAYWNLYERVVEEEEHGKITVNGQPLLFFHFSRWNISNPRSITAVDSRIKYDPMLMYEGKDFPALSKLGEMYRDRLIANGYETSRQYPYAFSHFESGELITPAMRSKYFDSLKQGRTYEASPFANYSYLSSVLGMKGFKSILRKAGKQVVKAVNEILD